jgi:6-phosphogluconolactonase
MISSMQGSATALAQRIADLLTMAIHEHGHAVLCVSGGKSPVDMFQALRDMPLAWDKVSITLADERCVPIGHPHSNASLVIEHLLQGLASQAQFVPLIDAQEIDPLNLNELANRAHLALSALGSCDVLVLGMGEDGHTASLFSHANEITQALDMHNPLTCLVMHLNPAPPEAPYPRISQTLRSLLRARHIVLTIQGAAKLAVLQRAQQDLDSRMPVSYVLNQHTTPVEIWTAP